MANDIQEKIDSLAAEMDADIVTYFGDIKREEDVYLIKKCGQRRLRKNLLLLLTTYGGDPNAAFRIARCFQSTYKTKEIKKDGSGAITRKKEGDFIIYIDSLCKSAGTIICLGADKIIMSANAELGPIDVQLRKQDEVGERTSGLTPIQAVQFLETQSVQLFKRHFKELRFSEELGFSSKVAAEIAGRMAIGLLTPIYEQIDPIRLAEVDRSLRIASEYGKRLQTNNLQDKQLERLLAEYPSHGFVIDRVEATEIFNNVEEPSEKLNEIMEFFRHIATMTIEKDDTFVYFISSEPPAPVPEKAAGDGNLEGQQ